MKKIVITIAAVVFATVAAQAQSPRVEAGIMSDSWRGSLALNRKVEQKVQRAEATHNQGTSVKQNTQNTPAAKPAQKAPAKKPAAKPATPKKNNKKTGTAKKGTDASVGEWLQAVFLGGKFPGETDEAYRSRLLTQAQPASMPFK